MRPHAHDCTACDDSTYTIVCSLERQQREFCWVLLCAEGYHGAPFLLPILGRLLLFSGHVIQATQSTLSSRHPTASHVLSRHGSNNRVVCLRRLRPSLTLHFPATSGQVGWLAWVPRACVGVGAPARNFCLEVYAPKYGAYSKNTSGAASYPAALLGFALPTSTGKPFVDKIWSASIPTSYWDGVLYMLGLLHVSGTFHLYCCGPFTTARGCRPRAGRSAGCTRGRSRSGDLGSNRRPCGSRSR
jgi:hypothetical protein